MKARSLKRRKLVNYFVNAIASLAALIGIFFLAWILFEVAKRGITSLNWNFFTERTLPTGSKGGMGNCILGTIMMTFIATLIGVPIGIFTGIFLAEFVENSKFGDIIRLSSNVIMSTPSIIIGLFVYTLMVLPPYGKFSGYAGAVALSLIILPVVSRTTEDMLSMVPNTLRESALALGSPQWVAITKVIFRSAKSGIITGIILAIARATGETAPLLFTAMNSSYWPGFMTSQTANLTVTIYEYAMQPYKDLKELAWGASFLITISILGINIFTRVLFKGKTK
ncbi:phosphate ABC transporter permease PstA [bacterium]|nr:phosphate ABC transporter permease PstA [bacterium]